MSHRPEVVVLPKECAVIITINKHYFYNFDVYQKIYNQLLILYLKQNTAKKKKQSEEYPGC